MTRAVLIGSSLALSIALAGCGKDTATPPEKEWKAYQPPVATGALTDSGAVVPKVGTGSLKQ